MEEQLQTLGLAYDFVEAVDGRELRLPDPDLVDPALSSQPWFRPGMAGCGLSHRRAWESVLAEGLDRALILEDDVILPGDIASLAEHVGRLMTGPEVVLLNFHTERPCTLVREGSLELPRRRQLHVPAHVEQLTSAGAYVVTREACMHMAALNRPMSIRADQWGVWMSRGALERVRCVAPLAVRKDFRFVSVVGHHPSTTLRGRLQYVARHQVPLLYQVLAFRRHLIERKWSRLKFVDELPKRTDVDVRTREPATPG